eukprot:TRINITY_DN4857_c0_g1_i1.p1 TRINITY_DN4857_c0_g1~~TRINITY_DN4857_c0_g1_i1.p1  ORF type:complete len:174 (+),score=27.12 TRINITY_DN4857_c0_g1_i1:528-1049(+)
MDDSSFQRIPLSYINDLRPTKTAKPESELNSTPDIEAAQTCLLDAANEDIGNTKHTKALVRKLSLRGDKKSVDNMPVEHSERNIKHAHSEAEPECFGFLLPNTTTKPLIVQVTSPTFKNPCKDAADGLWQRYKRATVINPSKIVLMFATLSSMGTIILIYFTLRSEALAALYS